MYGNIKPADVLKAETAMDEEFMPVRGVVGVGWVGWGGGAGGEEGGRCGPRLVGSLQRVRCHLICGAPRVAFWPNSRSARLEWRHCRPTRP